MKYDITKYLKDDKELQKAVIEALLTELSELEEYIERMDKPKIQVIDAEILTLKEENAKLNAIIDSYQPRLQRYKDILQEIREYAESIGNEEMINGYAIRAKSALWQIANKITKAEEE